MPFSTGAGPESVVISFGLPALGFFSVLTAIEGFLNPPSCKRSLAPILAISTASLASIVVTTLLSPDTIVSSARAVIHVIGFTIFLRILFISAEGDRSRRTSFSQLNNLMVYSGAVMAAYYIAKVVITVDEIGVIPAFSERFTGGAISLPWGATNVIAAALIMPIVCALVCLQLQPKCTAVPKWALLLMSFAVVLTLSRTGIAAVTLVFFLYAFFTKHRKMLLLMPALLAAAIVTLQIYDDQSASFIFSIRVDNTTELTGLNGRFDIWKERIDYFMNNPLTPVGYYGSLETFDHLTSHNFLLTTLLEQGVLGLLITLALLIYSAGWLTLDTLRSRGMQRKVSAIYLMGLLGIVVDLSFEDANFTQQYIIYFWVFLALAYLSRYGVAPSVKPSA